MSDIDDLSDISEDSLEREAALELELEELENKLTNKPPNCFCFKEPKGKWEWNQLEEFKDGHVVLNCHFSHRYDGLFIDKDTKITEVDLSNSYCDIESFMTFFDQLDAQVKNIQVFRFPNFTSLEKSDYKDLFEKVKQLDKATILDFSHSQTFTFGDFDAELFKTVANFYNLKEIKLPLLPIRAENDCDGLKDVNTLPSKLTSIHLGTFDVTVTQNVFSKFRKIENVSSCFQDIAVTLPSYYKVNQEPFSPALLKSFSGKYLESSEELKKSELNPFWDLSRLHDLIPKDSKVKVAVLDSGFHACHTNLLPRLAAFRSSVRGFAQSDSTGRGTHCAGLVSLLAEDTVDLMIGKIYSDSDKEINEENVADAIKWATSEGADIILLPTGAPSATHEKLFKQVQDALTAGKIIICGNGDIHSPRNNNVGYPAKFGSTICVAASDESKQPISGQASGKDIDFLAPGKNIWSYGVSEKFYKNSGSAQAASFVTALCALLLAFDRANRKEIKNNVQMKQLLRSISASPDQHSSAAGYGNLLISRIFRNNWSEELIVSTFYKHLSADYFDY